MFGFQILTEKKKYKKKTRKEQSKKKKEKESNRGAGVLTFIKLICYNIFALKCIFVRYLVIITLLHLS